MTLALFPRDFLPPLLSISTVSPEATGLISHLQISDYASAAYPSASRIIAIPFHLEVPIVISQLWWANGAAVSGNIDVGIYSPDFRLLVSTGSTAQAGTSVKQVVTVADTRIGPGDFFFAVTMDNTTGTLYTGTFSSTVARVAGVLHKTSTFPLPDTMTPATASVADIPLFGLTHKGTA